MPDLGRLGDERVEEALHLRRLAQRLLVVQGLRVQGWNWRNLFQPEIAWKSERLQE